MATYTFTPPLMNRSTKPFNIMDDTGTTVGQMQRYFTFAGQSFISIFINVAHVKVKEKSNSVTFDCKEKSLIQNLLCNKWDVTFHSNEKIETFELLDKTKIKTNQRFIYRVSDRTMEVRSEIFDKTTRFYQTLEGESHLVAEASYKNLLPPVIYTLKIFDDRIHFCEIAGIYYVMLMNSSD